MNTIPITFNENEIPYTVLGGTGFEKTDTPPLFSVVILNRGSRYFSDDIFRTLQSYKFQSVFAIGSSQPSADIETISEKFPAVKFITPIEKITIGEMINICAGESKSEYLFVLWNDTFIEAQGFASKMLQQLEDEKRICTAPLLLDTTGQPMLCQVLPTLKNSNFDTHQTAVLRDRTPTLYPIDFIGIYNREKLINIGGFDYTIKNPYWQVLDFGLRSKLWGFEISVANTFKVKYAVKKVSENTSADESYRIFYLKNLAPTIINNEAVLPKKLFFSYKKASGQSFLNALTQFKSARTWVALTKNRFKTTAQKVIQDWEPFI